MGGFVSEAMQSGSVLLREGLEAILVIAALAAFLRKAHAHAAVIWLYAGAGRGRPRKRNPRRSVRSFLRWRAR